MQIRLLFIIAILFLPLFARENPFFPVSGSSAPNYSTNQLQKPKPFDKATIKLPDSARILKSVTLTLENLDGSVTKQEIVIDKAIDWHDTIVIYEQKKEHDAKEQPAAKPQPKQKARRFKKLGEMPFITFYIRAKELKIVTKDKLIRRFKLVKPNRIVLDFKRNAAFRTHVFKGEGIFKKITLGNHDGYYRAVIELDGHYIYHIAPLEDGYLLRVE